jgi:hypothetical protein
LGGKGQAACSQKWILSGRMGEPPELAKPFGAAEFARQ